MPLAAWITIFLVIIVFVNIWPVKLYGEVEFWFSFLKCLALVAIIFFMIVMTSGGIPATRGPIEFRYWKDPGAFVNGIRGIAAAFVQAGFSFGGGKCGAPRLASALLTMRRRAHCRHGWRGQGPARDCQAVRPAAVLAHVHLFCG